MGDYTSQELDIHLCANGYCQDGYFVDMSTQNNRLRPTCRKCPTVTKDGTTYSITGTTQFNETGITIDEFKNNETYDNLQQCGANFFVNTSKSELYDISPGISDSEMSHMFSQEISGINDNTELSEKPTFCQDVVGETNFHNLEIDEFILCVDTMLDIRNIRTKLGSYERYNQITIQDIQEIHNMLNILMNLEMEDIRSCLDLLENPDKCTIGFTRPLLALVHDIKQLMTSLSLEIRDDTDVQKKQEIQDEYKIKLPLTIHHLIDISKEYEESYMSGCERISDNTEYTESLYSSQVLSIGFGITDVAILGIAGILGYLLFKYIQQKLFR
jgi:hypothetical protein